MAHPEALIAALRGGPAVPLDGPIVVTAWFDGRAIARVQGSELGPIVEQLHHLPADRLAGSRLQVDRIVGHAPLGANHPLVSAFALPGIGDALAVNPGID